MIKYKPLEDIYPFKPGEVVTRVRVASDRNFTSDKHQRAWKMFHARPGTAADDPAATDKQYCAYHAPYQSYTYSQAWVDFLVAQIADDAVWATLASFKL